MPKIVGVELRHLRSFVTIAETLNFSAAAARLHVTQPALSRQMRDLEQEIGANLFDRLSKGVRLTPTGRRFLVGARRVLVATEALLATTRGGRTACAPLRIAHFGSVLAGVIAPVLRRFSRRYPTLRLQMEEQVPAEALRELRAGQLDAVFTGGAERTKLHGLEFEPAWTAPQLVLLAANHAYAKRRSVRLDVLRNERWAVWNEEQFPGFRHGLFDACRRAGFRPKVAATIDSLSSVYFHVGEGDFVSYAPLIAGRMPHPGVVFVPPDPPDALPITVSLVWRRGSPHAEALRWLGAAISAETVRAGIGVPPPRPDTAAVTSRTSA